jgi:hypothetical protein
MDVIHGPRRLSPGPYDAWLAIMRAGNPRFDFTDPNSITPEIHMSAQTNVSGYVNKRDDLHREPGATPDRRYVSHPSAERINGPG